MDCRQLKLSSGLIVHQTENIERFISAEVNLSVDHQIFNKFLPCGLE